MSHESQAALQRVSGLLWSEFLKAAVADPVVLAEIVVNRFEAVVGLASNDVWVLSLGVALPANNPLMSQPRSNIVEGRASRNDRVGTLLIPGQKGADVTAAGMEHLGDVAVGKQSALFVSLLAHAAGLVQQPLGRGKAIDAPLHILGGGDDEEDGDEFGIDDAPVLSGRVVDADGHPEHLPVFDMVAGTHVLENDF